MWLHQFHWLTLARRGLTALAAGAAAILCLRAFLGPFQIGPVTVSSPLTLEQFFGAVFVLLVICPRKS